MPVTGSFEAMNEVANMIILMHILIHANIAPIHCFCEGGLVRFECLNENEAFLAIISGPKQGAQSPDFAHSTRFGTFFPAFELQASLLNTHMIYWGIASKNQVINVIIITIIANKYLWGMNQPSYSLYISQKSKCQSVINFLN